jgi:hypothetical protein
VVVALEFSVERDVNDGCAFGFELIALGGEKPIELRVVGELARLEEA